MEAIVRVLVVMTTLFAMFSTAPLAANVVGGDLQNFNPVPGGIDYVTVQSSETLDPGFFNLSLMLNHAVNSLPYFEGEADSQNRLRYNDSLTMLDTGIGIGVWDKLEAGIAFQSLVAQKVSESDAHGEFTSSGVINYRVYGKARLLDTPQGGLAVVTTGMFNRLGKDPYQGEGGSPVGVVEVAGDTKVVGIALALNLGYRFRKKGQPLPGYQIQPAGNQYIGSVGVSYLLPFVDTKLVVEAFGARPAEGKSRATARQASSAEVIAGIKHDITTHAAFHVGGGTELLNGVSSPDWRVYAGINWAFQPDIRKALPLQTIEHVAAKEDRVVLRNINFASGSDQIPPDAVGQLESLAVELKAAPYDRMFVEGHTDSVGSAASNFELSRRRAEAVRQWLITHASVAGSKIEAVGFGEDRPIADNGNFQGRLRNRRVEVRIIR